MTRLARLRLVIILFAGIMPWVPVTVAAAGVPIASNGLSDNGLIRIESQSALETSLNFNLSGLEHKQALADGETYDIFELEGSLPSLRVGWPELPVVVRYVLIPPESGVELEIYGLQSERMTGINPFPAQPRDLDGDADMVQGSFGLIRGNVIRSAEAENYDGFWPPENARLGRPAVMRGYRIVPIIINPVRFNPRTREIEILRSADFRLNFNTDLNRVNLVTNPGKMKPSRMVDRIIDDLVINPPPHRDDPHTQGSIVYVIGNWNDVANELAPLIEWRRQMGWTAEILRVQQNYNAEAVRTAIREAYEEWEIPPEYVVICGDTDGQWPIAFFDTRRGANFPYESDHQYGCLDGDDVLPEAAVGRLIYNSIQILRGIVSKTIRYEREPFIGENDAQRGWQTRAVLVAADNQSGTSSIDVCRWTKDLVERNGFTEVNEFYWSPQNPRPNAQNFIIENINAGASIFIYRGWTFMSGFRFEDVDGLRNGRMLPLAILATCNTGDYGEHISSQFYYNERFNYHPNGGGIGAIGAAGATHTAYNNLIAASTIKGLFVDDLTTQGWAFFNGKLDLYRHYADRGDINHRENPGLQAWLAETYIFNMMGDPAVDLFTAVPQQLTVEHPEIIRSGETRVDVRVLYADGDETPVEGALVCLYNVWPQQQKGYTDADGRLSFNITPAWTEEGTVKLTVSGHNLMTYVHEFETEEAEMFVGVNSYEIDDDGEGESRGDGDGVANPTERLELTVDIRNFGTDRPEGAVNLQLTAASPLLEVIQGEARLDEAPEPGESATVDFIVEINGGFPALKSALFNLTAVNGDNTWESSLSIPVNGYKFQFVEFQWEDEPLRPGDFALARIVVRNIGEKDSPELSAQLIPISRTLEVTVPDGRYDEIAAGETGASEANFRIRAHPYHIGGSRAELALILTNDDGFVDTVGISFIVDQPRPGNPFGPDGYGYICFDDTDENWFVRPTYDWIEIDPRRDGPGENTGLVDRMEEGDASIVTNLPFPFQYYGEEFEQVTINTNGWIALGDKHEIITARNRRIPGGMVSSAMICPFWDDLITTDNGGIYTYYDEDNHWFIVQWSNMRKLGPRANQEPLQTFQVILYDSRYHPSFTGDGDIKFQYQMVSDIESAFQEWDTPYATVGIGSVDQTTGLEYTYWGELNGAAAPLDSGRAILFTTMLDFTTAVVTGHVTDLATGEPIEGAVITAIYGFSAVTDENGIYMMEDVLVDTNTTYWFTASKQFYNDSTRSDFELEADDTLVVDFALAHPEFNLEFERVQVEIEPENANDFWMPLRNTGNGTLTFTSKLFFIEPDRDELWDVFLEFDVTNAITDIQDGDTLRIGNTFISGACFVDSVFYVVGGGSDRNDLPAKWYRFTRDGAFIDSVAQPWIDNRGLRGVATDGELIFGGFNNQIHFFNKENLERVDTLNIPFRTPSDITYDRANELIYICGITNEVFAIDRDGNVVNSFRPTYEGIALRKYGLAWYPSQPDSLKLFIFTEYQDRNVLFGMNPESGEIRLLKDLTGDPNDRPLGIDVTDRWNSSVWTLVVGLSNSNGDRFQVLELEPNTSWLSYEPVSGTLSAGRDTTFHIRVESGQRPFDRYWLTLRYTHNAEPGFKEIPIEMRIVEASRKRNEETAPVEFTLEPNFPNPFNPVTTVSFTLPERSTVVLSVYDALGRLVHQTQPQQFNAGRHRIGFDGRALSSGVYLYQLQAGSQIAVRKMVLMK